MGLLFHFKSIYLTIEVAIDVPLYQLLFLVKSIYLTTEVLVKIAEIKLLFHSKSIYLTTSFRTMVNPGCCYSLSNQYIIQHSQETVVII